MAKLEINLSHIKNNILSIKRNLQKTKFCLVVKANAYGFGDKKICKFVEKEIDYFAVSCESEFLRVRAVTKKPILLLDPIYENITKLAKQSAEFCVPNLKAFYIILKEAKRHKLINYKIHLAINTGMNRFGFNNKNEIIEISEKIKKVQNISILGVFSHYFQANNENFVNLQYEKFKEYQKLISKIYTKNKPIFHICASFASAQKDLLDMVRIGIFAYSDKFFQTIKLTAKIIDFQSLKKGESAGYNRQFIAKKKTKLAIVSIGYADGIFRSIAGSGYVLINDNFCKIVAICMDSILVDVTSINCKIYDDATIIGKDKMSQIFICDLARWCGTIDYEILTSISERVERIYIKDKENADNNRKI